MKRFNSPGFKVTGNVRRVIALMVAVTSLNLFLASLPSLSAAPRSAVTLATGIIQVAGTVTVDGTRANSGQTLFTGSRIAIAEGSQSIIDLGAGTRFVLAAETDLTLDFSKTNIATALGKGKFRGFVPVGLPLTVRTEDAELTTDSSQPSAFTVQILGDTTMVTVQKGRVEVRAGERLESVGAGQVFSSAPGSPGQTEPPDDDDDDKKKIGIFVAIGAAAAILATVLIGRDDDPEDEFGDCVIILSGPGSTCI